MIKWASLIPFLLLLLSSFPGLADSEEAKNRLQQLTQQIDALEKQDNTPEVIKALDTLTQAKRQLEKTAEFKRQTQQYRDLITNFDQQTQALEEQINAFSATQFPDFDTWDQEQLTLEVAEQDSRLEQLEQSRNDDKNDLQAIEQGIDDFSYQSELLREKIKRTEKQLKHERQQEAAPELVLPLEIAHEYYVSQLYALEAKQLSAGNRRTLAKQRIQLSNAEIEARQAYRNNLERRLTRLQRAEIDEQTEEQEPPQPESEPLPQALQTRQAQNERYGKALETLVNEIDQVRQQQQTAAEQEEVVNQTASDLEAMAEWLKLSPAFSENLRSRINRLPDNPPIETLDRDIARNQIQKYEYRQQLDLLNNEITRPRSGSLTPAQQQQAQSLLESNIALLEQLLNTSDTLIYQQATLKVAYENLNTNLNELKAQAIKRLFWAPDTNPLSLNVIIGTWEKLKWFFSPFQWVNLLKIPTTVDKATQIFVFTTIVILLLGLSRFRKRWKKYLKATSQKIGKVTQDKFRFSIYNVCIAFLLAWPFPFAVGLLGYLLSDAWQYPFIHHLGQALSIPASLAVYCFMRELVRDEGIFISHFDWDQALVQRCFAHYRRLIWIYLPLAIVQNFANLYSDIDVNATLGRLAFLISNLAVSFFLWRLYHEKIPMTYRDLPAGKAHIGHNLFWWTLILIPQVLNYTALSGYLTSSQSVMTKLEISAVMGVITLLVYYLIKRLMLIQKRRLAFERAKAKRQEILAQRLAEVQGDKEESFTSSEMHIEIEEPEIDLERISAQSLRLLRSLLLLIYLTMVAVVWSDFYQAITFLEDITLWDVSTTIDGIDELSAISLKSVLLAGLAFWLTAIITRDLPGAMELLILQHLDLSPGTGYAITSLTRYTAIFLGIIIGSGLIGFDWSKMQWLIAALGVGLGFGLQEIFANFISGLIILFEKPIRIGDTVTIRELTGVIAKIKTRATTIVDWDRKEVIVPNKAFVTEQFINWSLSDPITRVTLVISVKYLDDTELVTQLLFEAAEECELVLDNPAPEVFFLSLSADSQNYEVRAYAAETAHRLVLTHDMHSRIKRKFIEHNITIASPQLEVTVKNRQGHPGGK
ncbi:miniconductance mechanosensitive channel MscM [Photobacterium sp. TY1-4]|uniref:miniconductance mechanosensitive channel MscM n=1 Tax=Photobacterium sp. TY1-4 TaxID=2899122 RepID=UPI0021BF1366|nr:miniconductance mechanosensitive channel MscM [Photobacterium sp. TY1-4]UXI02181.1 miniconductance mechanosensitive channel MscM [Photobacterium sp. TY1-4]